MRFEPIKSVPIPVYIKGELLSISEDYTLGLWEHTPERQVWGLLHLNYPTYMSYGFDYSSSIAHHCETRRQRFKEDPDADWFLWYFDAGNKITVTLDDLEAATKELGIWDRDDRKSLQ